MKCLICRLRGRDAACGGLHLLSSTDICLLQGTPMVIGRNKQATAGAPAIEHARSFGSRTREAKKCVRFN
jgi:hypothetical protein